ncbi:TonB-dependent siderophore receptor [Herbaspirillum rubrisubalbicans]|uniref:TonB-dependent siderophore receptor n=1 Tax=Herbaspirillum rubrisubalbicans TaxID=80842 RepID=A0AAD0U4I7_9BURK|nr:TonB-dependent siderophore receptor [Herbaspirillum rubrisubalbicans]AYR23083.1 TonB-dependent siderophore receptor [Herbaspirillum rubrisubalbicans]
MKRIAPLASTLMLTLAGTSLGLSAAARAADTPDDKGEALPTVNVTASGAGKEGARVRSAAVAGFDDAPLLDTPASVAVVTGAQMRDQQSRVLSDVVKNDASINENYAPVGYYENFSIRGVTLDPASAYRIDGLTVAGEQTIALENKERVEFLKGVAGLQAGVSSAGGIVNYVTKRPANVRSITLGSDSYGSRYLATDLGALFGEQQQFGLRLNAAHEDIHSYVNNGDGWRDFASLAATWALSSKTLLQFDAEYQQKAQHSVAGYQLLGGTTLPSGVSPKTMLTPQSWAQPVRDSSLNYRLRLDTEFNANWRGYVQAGRSRAVIDDYLAFPYGSGGGASSTFAANGDFDVYDYRVPDDERHNDDAQAVMIGKFATGWLQHELTVGLEMSRRVVDKSDGISVLVGSGNIYTGTPALAPATTLPGPAYRNLDSRQKALFLSDRLQFSERWQVIAGGRQVWLNEQAFGADGSVTRNTARNLFLPQLALIYKPAQNMSLYGSYAETLTLGSSAPFWVSNFPTTLPPSVARQLEAGVKYDVSPELALTAAIFRIRKAYEFQQPDNSSAGFTYVQQGRQTNTGIELGASGKLAPRLAVGASVSATRARASDTGTAAYDDQQVVNVPRLRSSVYADYAVPSLEGLNLLGSWLYSSSKPATRDGSVSLPAVHVFNAGLRYRMRLNAHTATLRANVDNLFDKRYWKDAGQYLGDGYVHLGAPRTVRVSLQYDF